MRHSIFKMLVVAAISTCSFAASGTQRLLVPVYSRFETPGAYGSVWVTELAILNTSTEVAQISNYFGPCGPVTCLPMLIPTELQVADGYITQAINGPAAVLLIDDQYAGHFAAQLRIRDVSRVAEGYGTWFPVVDEASFKHSVLHLIDIPLNERYRQMLRVYSMDAPTGSRVRVRMYATEKSPAGYEDPLIAEVVLPISGGFPQYAQLGDLAAQFQQAKSEQFRITVEPDGDFHIWSMVSVTNNDTQQVTAIFPSSH